MKMLLPIILLLLGTGAGVGAGVFLKPPVPEGTGTAAEVEYAGEDLQADDAADDDVLPEYITLNNQFVVPVVGGDLVESLVVLSLGVEVKPGSSETIYRSEPKLRDAFLQVLFDHANMGGFRGRFTDGNNMDVLRLSLTEAAQSIVGDDVTGIMVTDIARQDI